MKTIGITGGVGCGKSAVLEYIADRYNARVIYADNLANELESPNHECYDDIVRLLGSDILATDGTINKKKMAAAIFADETLLKQVNGIVHPAVKKCILEEIDKEKTAGKYDLFILEAALLIQDGYDKILDELWYVYTDEEVRRGRLKTSRGYSDEKIDSIMRSQLSEDEYMDHCVVKIDNSGDLKDTYRQIDEHLKNLPNGGFDELS